MFTVTAVNGKSGPIAQLGNFLNGFIRIDGCYRPRWIMKGYTFRWIIIAKSAASNVVSFFFSFLSEYFSSRYSLEVRNCLNLENRVYLGIKKWFQLNLENLENDSKHVGEKSLAF